MLHPPQAAAIYISETCWTPIAEWQVTALSQVYVWKKTHFNHISTEGFFNLYSWGFESQLRADCFSCQTTILTINHNKNISKSLGNNQDSYLHFNWNNWYHIKWFTLWRTVQNGGRMLRDYPSSLIKGRLMCVVNNRCIESFIKYKRIFVWNALNNIEVDITVSDKITSTYRKKGLFFL